MSAPARVSASAIDQMTWYQRIESMTVNNLVARLRGQEEPGLDAEAGTALHDLLEQHKGGSLSGEIEHGGFRFDFNVDGEIQLPQAREAFGSRFMDVFGRPVEIRCKADGLTGGEVVEYKLTKNPTEEAFSESFQWRAYLYVFQAQAVRYHCLKKWRRDRLVKIDEMHSFTMRPYPGMLNDLKAGIANLLAFCDAHCPDALMPKAEYRHE
jgi:hypothetical protein